MSNSQARERNWNQNDALLLEAARAAGIDPSIMVKIAGFESNFNAAARPISISKPQLNTMRQWDGTMAMSTAYGFGQFLDDTWLKMVRTHGEKYGIENAESFSRAQANAAGVRDNPRLQAAMLAEFTRENIAAGARLGGPDPDANVYAMHNLGSGDARTFLNALRTNPSQRADRVLSASVISGNPSLYGNGSRSVAEAYRAMAEHMDAYAPFANRIPGSRHEPTAAATSPALGPATQGSLQNVANVPSRPGSAAIYDEAHRHFLSQGNEFEYGRGDMPSRNSEGNGRIDRSRNEQDLDGDGLRGVDCSSFVWRGLKNAGYNLPPNTAANPFTTHDLFNGHAVTAFARQNFDVIPGAEARRNRGELQPGDILMFKDKDSRGQHVGIFKGYDANGRIQFIGSQVNSGPAQAGAGQGSYWNGGEFEIVGALRAKPEFQVRPPMHAGAAPTPERASPARPAEAELRRGPAPELAADADLQLRQGEKGPAVTALQQRLADLGYRGKDGKPVGVDGEFGDNTKFALQAFQREHGLEGRGVAGPKTEAALDHAERSLMSHTSHPHHALYAQVLERLHSEERARGARSGHHSERIAAALAVECVREGITRVDRIELNRDATLVRAVQVSPMRDESGLNRSTDGISPAQAARQPMLESSEQIHQVAVNRQAREHDARQQQQQQQSPPRAVPAM